jgi:hypothetical protein
MRWLGAGSWVRLAGALQLPLLIRSAAVAWVEPGSEQRAALDALSFMLVLGGTIALSVMLQPSARAASSTEGDKPSTATIDAGKGAFDRDGDGVSDNTGDTNGATNTIHQCCVCQDRNVEVRFSCGHAVCCKRCTDALHRGTRERASLGCPICRVEFVEVDSGAHVAHEPDWLPPPTAYSTLMLSCLVLCVAVGADSEALWWHLQRTSRTLTASPPDGSFATAFFSTAFNFGRQLLASLHPAEPWTCAVACVSSFAHFFAWRRMWGVVLVDAGAVLALIAWLPSQPSALLAAALGAATVNTLLALVGAMVESAFSLDLLRASVSRPHQRLGPVRRLAAIGSQFIAVGLLLRHTLHSGSVAAWPVVGVSFVSAGVHFAVSFASDSGTEDGPHAPADEQLPFRPAWASWHRPGSPNMLLLVALVAVPFPLNQLLLAADGAPDARGWRAKLLNARTDLTTDALVLGAPLALALGAVIVLARAMHLSNVNACMHAINTLPQLLIATVLLAGHTCHMLATRHEVVRRAMWLLVDTNAPPKIALAIGAAGVALATVLLVVWMLSGTVESARLKLESERAHHVRQLAERDERNRRTSERLHQFRRHAASRERVLNVQVTELTRQLHDAEEDAAVAALPPLFPDAEEEEQEALPPARISTATSTTQGTHRPTSAPEQAISSAVRRRRALPRTEPQFTTTQRMANSAQQQSGPSAHVLSGVGNEVALASAQNEPLVPPRSTISTASSIEPGVFTFGSAAADTTHAGSPSVENVSGVPAFTFSVGVPHPSAASSVRSRARDMAARRRRQGQEA